MEEDVEVGEDVEEMLTEDSAHVSETNPEEAALAAMSPEERADYFARLSPEEQAAMLANMSPEERALALEAMSPEERAACMLYLPEDMQQEALSYLNL